MPVQTTLYGSLSVAIEKDGTAALLIDPGVGHVYVIPLDKDTAKAVGQKLTAPNVEVATGPLKAA